MLVRGPLIAGLFLVLFSLGKRVFRAERDGGDLGLLCRGGSDGVARNGCNTVDLESGAVK